jgi:hypothetical protein
LYYSNLEGGVFLKKILYSLAAVTIALSPLSVNIAHANIEPAPTYSNLTEELSFYRITRGFVSPLHELDNNLDTKIEFTRLDTTTFLSYVFIDDIYIKEILFTANEASKYQRIILYFNGGMSQVFNLANYPNGIIPINSTTTKIDSVRYQFNGVAGVVHQVSELEIIGIKATTGDNPAPTGESKLVTPAVIAELIIPPSVPGDGTGGDGEPTVPVEPTEPVVIEPGDGTGGDGEPTVPVEPTEPVVIEPGDGNAGDGEPIIPEEPTDPVVPGDGEPGDGTPPLPEEEPTVPEEIPGDKQFIDNNENGIPDDEEIEVPIEGTPVVPVDPTVPGEGSPVEPTDPVEPVVPGDDTPVIPTEPVDPETPVEPEPVIPTEPVEPTVPEEPTVPVEDEVIAFCDAHPLTPSVFKNPHIWGAYSINSASLKLMDHKDYNEFYLLNKLDKSVIVYDDKNLSIKEFVSVLKIQKYSKYSKSSNKKDVDCAVASSVKIEKDNGNKQHNNSKDQKEEKELVKSSSHSSSLDKYKRK